MDYNSVYESFIQYTNRCRELIKSTFFTSKDTKYLKCEDESRINEIVSNHRNKMIDIKLMHTMRMIEQIIKINEILGVRIDLNLVIKVAILYHDIGRFRQATWSNSFSDRIYEEENQPFINHGEDGYDIFMNEDFCVLEKYIPIIGQSILHHVDLRKEPRLHYRFKNDLNFINIDEIITGKKELTASEWQIASLIVQLVADVDKADILYQHLTDDFDMIRDYVTDNSGDSLDDIAKYWGVSKEEIIEYNQIDEDSYVRRTIKIPIRNMPIEKLEVKDYMKRMFYDNSWPDLKELIKDRHWNFVSILWWRISHFLNELTFTSTLINIEESNLLEEIYKKVPDRLKPLVSEAFQYAQEVLVKEKIDAFSNNIYL